MKLIPPTTATWMLKHLVLGKRNEALEGDLLEEFQRRRSLGWYWRQVLRAVLLSFSNALWSGWAVIWTVLFAGFWVCGLYGTTLLTAHLPFQRAFSDWLRLEPYHGYPIWMAEGIIFYIAAPLAVYLALTQNLTLRAFTVGLGVGAAGLVISLSAPFHQLPFSHPLYRALNTFLEFLVAYARTEHWNVRSWVQMYDALRLSLALLAGIGATKLKRSALRRLPGAVATTIRSVMLGIPRQAPCD